MIKFVDNGTFQAAKRCHAAAVDAFLENPRETSATWLRVVVECGILIAAVEEGVPVVGAGVWSVVAAASTVSAGHDSRRY